MPENRKLLDNYIDKYRLDRTGLELHVSPESFFFFEPHASEQIAVPIAN